MKDFYLDKFFRGAFTATKYMELHETLNKEIFTIKTTGIHYRNLRHWDQQGLLLGKRVDDAKWRKFSFVDYVWIKIIGELREFGAPFDLIKELRKKITEEIPFKFFINFVRSNPKILDTLELSVRDEVIKAINEPETISESEGLSILFLIVVDCIINKDPLSLVIFKDGSWLLLSEKYTYTEEDLERLSFESQIRVSIAKIIRGFLVEEKLLTIVSALKIFSEAENSILRMVADGDYTSVTIFFKSKKKRPLELEKETIVKSRLVQAFSEGDYSQVLIKSASGLTSKIENK